MQSVHTVHLNTPDKNSEKISYDFDMEKFERNHGSLGVEYSSEDSYYFFPWSSVRLIEGHTKYEE